MKKIIVLTVLTVVFATIAKAQTTAMDFNRIDCNGNMRNLFTDLDSGKAVILEYFMGPNCTSCEDAAKEIEGMKAKFLTKYSGKVMSYAMGYQNSYACSTITSWVSNLGVSAIPMDSGALQVAYYGGFAMPTIAVVAGSSHKIIYTANANNGGYTNGDTSKISTELNKFFNPTGVLNTEMSISSISIFPNPSHGILTVGFDVKENASVVIRLVDVVGKISLSVLDEKVRQGHLMKTVSTTDLNSGLYIINITVDGHTISNKINIVN